MAQPLLWQKQLTVARRNLRLVTFFEMSIQSGQMLRIRAGLFIV